MRLWLGKLFGNGLELGLQADIDVYNARQTVAAQLAQSKTVVLG